MYMVRSGDGRPVGICENLPEAFSRSVGASACAAVGATITVVALEKRETERLVGTFQRINGDEIWCVTPMFPSGTVMRVDRNDNGVPVRRFACTPGSISAPVQQTHYEVQTQAAVSDLRSLLGMVHGASFAE